MVTQTAAVVGGDSELTVRVLNWTVVGELGPLLAAIIIVARSSVAIATELALMRARGVSEADYALIAAAPSDVPSYLSASDAGLAFIKPCFSKLASSPTKYAEYLGCGLPLIINAGIGDSDALITREGVGALVRDFKKHEYDKALISIESLVRDADETRRHSREVAERLFDIRAVGVNRYVRLYENVFNSAD